MWKRVPHFCILLLLLACYIHAQISQPISDDRQLQQSKFTERRVITIEDVIFQGLDATRFNPNRECNHNIDIAWSSEVGSSVYQTPLVTDLFSDGKREVIVPTFVRFLELLQGEDGASAPGWPFSNAKFASHSSPLLYDLNRDGEMEMVVATANGAIMFFGQDGRPLSELTIHIPRQRVRKDWYKGLNDAKVDVTMSLHNKYKDSSKDDDEYYRKNVLAEKEKTKSTTNADKTASKQKSKPQSQKKPTIKVTPSKPLSRRERNDKKKLENVQKKINNLLSRKRFIPSKRNSRRSRTNTKRRRRSSLFDDDIDAEIERWAAPARKGSRRRLAQAVDSAADKPQTETQTENKADAAANNAKAEPKDKLEHLMRIEGHVKVHQAILRARAHKAKLSDESKASTDELFSVNTPAHLRPFLQDDRDESIFDAPMPTLSKAEKREYVYVDPHILSTPVITDLDGDGHEELIITVSYYFDREQYSDPSELAKLPDPNIDLQNYVAGGVIVYDLFSMTKKWDLHLDLTTDKTDNRAHIYSSPSIIDLEGDGSKEIVVTTSLGFLYVIDKKGEVKEGYPKQMAEIQAQATVEDVNGDGEVEMCVVDFKSNLVCWDSKGKELWEQRLSGFASQAPTVGDVDGDGVLDLVVGTSTGHIWAVRGDNGKVLPNFPIKTNGPIYSQALLMRFNTGNDTISRAVAADPDYYTTSGPMNIVVPSFDGYLYIVDGKSGCVDKIDIGEKSYSMVLADDITGNGKMDLLVSTMNGNVYCYGTNVPYHPLKSWTSQTQGLNGFTAREGHHGIFVRSSSRQMRDVVGDNFKIQFEIVDNRQMPAHMPRRYHVKISIGRGLVLLQKTYDTAGVYVEVISTPRKRMAGTVYVEMINERGQVFQDAFSVTFNMNFFRIIKWLVVGPFVAAAVALLLIKGGRPPLPT